MRPCVKCGTPLKDCREHFSCCMWCAGNRRITAHPEERAEVYPDLDGSVHEVLTTDDQDEGIFPL